MTNLDVSIRTLQRDYEFWAERRADAKRKLDGIDDKLNRLSTALSALEKGTS